MLQPEYAREALRLMYFSNGGLVVNVGKPEYFVRGYDNYSGGVASIGNFNDIIQPGGVGNFIKIFYGNICWGMTNDNLGATNQLILGTTYWDLAGAAYSYTLQPAYTTGSVITEPFDSRQGSVIGSMSRVTMYGKCNMFFSGYMFPIS